MLTRCIAVSCIACCLLCAAASMASAEGLDTLIEVGKSMQEIAKETDRETASYKAVKQAVETGVIKEGVNQDFIVQRFGEPVVSVSQKEDSERWVYKPATDDFFKGSKIYLIFGADKMLKEIKVVEKTS